MALNNICNNLAKQFNFENIEKLFESNSKIEKIAQYDGYYKFPFLNENVVCVLNENNLFVNYSKLHTTISVGKFANKFVSAKFIGAFNQFLELCGEKPINTKEWSQAKSIDSCLKLINKKYYIHDPSLNPKSQIAGVYLPLSFLHHFLNAFNIEYRAQVADMMNMIGLNALFSNEETKTTTKIVQTITNNNFEELTSQIKELQCKYENERNKFIKENQQRVKYETECKNVTEKYNKYFEETEDYRKIANTYQSENYRLKSQIAQLNEQIRALKDDKDELEYRNNKLRKELSELYTERNNYHTQVRQEKQKEIDEYQRTIKRTNEFVSEIMQFIEPINKMISGNRCNTNKNKLNKFMTDNNIKMLKSYKVYNPEFESENKKYTTKKAKYETQLEDIKNINELKKEMKQSLINGFNQLTDEQQLELINVDDYNKSVEKARTNKKKIPQKHQFINCSVFKLSTQYSEYFSEYLALYDRIGSLGDNEENIQRKLNNLYKPVEYTIHYPKKDIQYKMRNIDSYLNEMRPIINFIRDKTEYDESDEYDK